MKQKFILTVERQLETESRISTLLGIARTTRDTTAMAGALREIGMLLSKECGRLPDQAAVVLWMETLKRRTRITLGEIQLANMAWRSFQARKTRAIRLMAQPISALRN